MADYEGKKGMNSFTAGLIGAVIGAVSSAAVIFMSNKENRKKTQEKFEDLKEKGTKAFHDIQKKGKELAEQVKSRAEDAKEEVEQRISRTKRKK